ncbi:transcriptional regulator, AraC family [Rhizobiales bacterium GAS113]|nr:transcriptional regulator, AraC family [Rhizobiales bacterium GAS113]
MVGRTHHVDQHRSAVAGIEAMTLASNHAFPRHSHDQFGIGLLFSGAQRSWSGIGPVESRAGDAIMVNPGEIHDGLPVDGCVRRWHILYFDPALVRREAADEMTSEIEVVRPTVRDPLLAERFGLLFASLTASVADPLATEESLLSLIMHVLRRHGRRQPPCSRPPPVAKALARMDAAPASPVTLTELAALSGVSRFQLLRGFAREVGITPHAYLIQRRVRLARELLAAGQAVAEAAFAAGFADQSHMTRAFVRQLGVTPGRYMAAIA